MSVIVEVLVQVSMDQSTFYSQFSSIITVVLCSSFDLNKSLSPSPSR